MRMLSDELVILVDIYLDDAETVTGGTLCEGHEDLCRMWLSRDRGRREHESLVDEMVEVDHWEEFWGRVCSSL